MANSSAEKILVVEDSLTQAVHLEALLAKAGYLVKVASNGQEAIEILSSWRPDLVISDIVMPGMDGFELCRRIKQSENTKDIPVMLVTHLSEPEDIIRGVECGADSFITKPYEEDFLISQVNYIFVNKALRSRSRAEMGLEVFLGNKKYFIAADRIQILDLLLSTYETAIRKARELEKAYQELKKAHEKVQILENLLPICSNCKRIRDEQGNWHSIEEYIGNRTGTKFSHGLCPDCARKLYPEVFGNETPKESAER